MTRRPLAGQLPLLRSALGLLLLGLVACDSLAPAATPSPVPSPAAAAPSPTPPAPAVSPRLVSLSPAITETLFALGLGPQVVGVTRYCDWPPAVKALPKVGGYLDPNFEAIVALRPTRVIVAPSPGNRRAVTALQRAGLSVLVVADRTLADLRQTLGVLGAQFDRQAQAAALLADLDTRLAAVQQRARTRPARKVLLVYGRRPLICAGASSFGGELLALIGAHNVCEGDEPYPLYSMERVLAAGPEVVLDGAMDGTGAVDEYWRRWTTLPAVQRGRVVWVDSAGMRPGPRLAGAVEALEQAIAR